ncbi:twin-arginine translocase TatA/TatE family subunit [Cellulomonas sp. ATA003]|uniref:twin-arginine translocase TatA/TatE family subunit n=1 Tax=Cellulomonas sp. ATA003 TaxID=3073064 RepID=UPI002873ED5E|nr:twin-arginine translocase TatA/TatE family subunit [Cellulomonas sp. ATA003]WNB85004.1 twin-arginine translocase TatA/TatE family subunit [Cellulomonas sp. ATA003]
MFGINGGELLLLLVVAVVVVGPERLPRYAEQLGTWVRTARRFALTAKDRVAEELGDDVADVDWAALDPRRYDPRRIVREALLDDAPSAGGPRRAADPRSAAAPGAASRSAAAVAGARAVAGAGGPSAAGGVVPDAPFDDEAT